MAGPAAMIANIFARFAYIVEEGTTSVAVHMYWGFPRWSATMCASKLAIVLSRHDGESVQAISIYVGKETTNVVFCTGDSCVGTRLCVRPSWLGVVTVCLPQCLVCKKKFLMAV